jgi:1-acyl-sn-glycerol-3-phosphate acyltransferase
MTVSGTTDASTSFDPPRRGTSGSRALARRVMRLFTWDIEGELPPCPKFVIIVAPHTSNWDFPICLLAMFAFGLQMTWLAKHSIFFFPVAPVLRWLGGEPVDRSAARGTVGAAIERFQSRTQWVLGISPEGTRRHTERWRTGFYRIAAGAGVPVVPVWIDYPRRRLGLGAPLWPSADEAADMVKLGAVFKREMAKYPERYAGPGPGGEPAPGAALHPTTSSG